MSEETYQLTPKGLLYANHGEAHGSYIEDGLKKYMKKAEYNAIVLEDGEFHFVTVEKEWD